MTLYEIVLTAFFVVMTIVGISVMVIDKQKAKKGAWRIKERTLFLVALIFGGVGTTIGMFTFRHKTKHWYFVVFMPLLAVINVVLYIYLLGIL